MIKIDKTKEDVAVEKEVETTTQTESPQVEVPSTEEQTAPTEVDQPKEEQVSDVKSEESKDPREFQIKRLADENKRLKQERQGSAFDAYRQKVVPGQVDVNSYTDEYGQTNWNAYNAAVTSHVQQVANAQASQIVEERLDEQSARTKHPELFDDPDTEQEIADRWIASKMRGENVSVTDIADRVAKRYSKDVSKAEKRGAEKILQEVSTKEQAGLSVSGETSQGATKQISDDDQALLEERTRIGDDDAIVARLKNIPWANK